MWPLGSDHRSRPRRSRRPISAARRGGGPPRGLPRRSRRRCATGVDVRPNGPRGARRSDRGRWTCGDGNDAATSRPGARHARATGPRSRPAGWPPKLVRRACPRRPPRSRARPGECGGGPRPDPPRGRRARRPVRRRRPPALPRRRQRARRAARPDSSRASEQTDLDFTTDAHPPAVLAVLEGWAEAVWDTGIAFGTVGARRHGTTVEITTFRADAYDRVSRNPVVAFGETIDDDLVRRDFTVNAMAVELTGGAGGPRPAVRRPARRARRAGRRHARHAGHARGVVRRRPAADAARGPVRLPARADPRAAGGRGDDGDGRASWRGSRRSGCRSSSPS